MTAAAWVFLALGIVHTLFGLKRFAQPIRETITDGFIGQFKRTESRRLAFWFTIFGPMMLLGGQVALHAAHAGDLALLRMIGFYVLAISIIGVLAFPKSPFWAPLFLGPVFIAGGYGWLA